MGNTRGYSLNELQSEEKGRQRRKLAEHAINLAMSGSWEEAVEVNRRLVEEFDPDVEAWNRLGKAYAQLGRIAEARGSYDAALALDPSNAIAQRNRQRLATLREEAQVTGSEDGRQADPAFFIEETGKTAATALFSDAPKETLARVAAGDLLSMRREGDVMAITTRSGDRLGVLEGKLSARLVELQGGGNEYAVATISVNSSKRELRVLIREMRQSPQLAGRVSFPAETTTGLHAYIRRSVIRDERIDEEEEDGEDGDVAVADDEDLGSDAIDFSEDMSEA